MAIIVHQSDLGTWDLCPNRIRLKGEGHMQRQTSRMAFGSVMHHSLMVLERTRDVTKAIATFEHYWHPLYIDAVCDPVPTDGWVGYDSYGELLQRGRETLKRYAELLDDDKSELLALEYEFIVPFGVIDGEEVYLGGSIDRLAAAYKRRMLELRIDDFKTGIQKWNLRHNVQGTVYAYASHHPDFWLGFDGEIDGTPVRIEGFGEERGRELALRFEDQPRRFTWINVRDFKWVDGGVREAKDWRRLRLAVTEVVRSIKADIFPLNLSGENCTHCSFRGPCGDGAGEPDPKELIQWTSR